MTPFWNTSRANKLLDLSADIDALKQYRVEINANKSQTEAMEIAMGNASQSAKDMAEGWDLSRGALNRWSASQKAAIKQTGFFKSAIASLKGVMASLGAMFINMAVMFAVTEGINLIIKGIDALITTADEAKEAAADLASSWKETDDTLASHKKTLDGIAAEYASLSKGVDSFGNNVSLTSDEFSRYNDLANQIADMFPELVSGWTDENNAILTTRGSVQALTDAYTALTDEQNRVKAAALESTLSTFKDAEMQIPFLPWKDTGSQLQASLAKQLLDAMSSGTINDLASTLGDDQRIILHDIMENAYGYSGVTPLWNALDDIIGDPKTLRAYYDKLITEMETTVRNVQDSISGILLSSDIYKNFDSSTKALISQVVQGIDNNFVAGFAGQDNAEIALRKWINDNLIDVFSGYDFSQIIDIKNLFDSSQISTGTYQKYYTDFIKSIEGFAPEIQTALGEAFDPDVSNLITNVQEKLLDEYDDQVFTLTLNELQIAANLDIADASWEELQSSISTTSALAAQAITDLTEDLTGLVGVYELIATAISEQNTSGYVTVETYQALIAANQDYANSFEVVNGQLQFNADSAYKLADAMSEIQLKEAQAGKDARRSAIVENLEQIEEYNKQLDLARGKEDADDYYKTIENKRDVLIDVNEQLENEYQQYEAIASQIRGTTAAYAEYLAAQKTANSGYIYESMSGVSNDLKKAIKQGKIVNDDVQSAVDYVLGGSSDGLTYEEQLKRAKEAQKKYARYFTEDNKGVANFGADLIKNGLATNKNGYTTLGEGVTGADIMAELGLSQDAVIAILKDLEEYGGQFNWGEIFPELTQEEIDNAAKPASEIEQAATDTLDQAKTAKDLYDEAAQIIAEGVQNVKDALSGESPNTEITPPKIGEAGGVSLFTAGPQTETTTPTPKAGNKLEEPITLSVVAANPLNPSDILPGVTENSDGSLSYDVSVNPTATPVPPTDILPGITDDGNGNLTYAVGVERKPDMTDMFSPEPTAEVKWETTPTPQEKNKIESDVQGTIDDVTSGLEWSFEDSSDPDSSIKSGLQGAIDEAAEGLIWPSVKPQQETIFPSVPPQEQFSNSDVTLTVSADTTLAQTQIDEFKNTLPNENQIKLSAFMETYDTNGKTFDQFVSDFLKFKNESLVIPADISTKELYDKIASFEGSLNTFIIPLESKTDEAYRQAVELKNNIEKLAPKMKVILKPGASAYASGTNRITKKQVGIVDDGKDGAETILRADGTAEIGSNDGPRAVVLNPGDQVLTGTETKDLLRRGAKSVSMPRFASGTPGSWPTIPTSASTSKSAKSKSVSWEKYFEKLFDWIEIRLDRLSRITDNWTRKVKDAIGYIAKNNTIDDAMKSLQDQISALETASAKYMAQANAVAKKAGLSTSMVKKIQNGTLDISEYSDSTKKKIAEYQNWYKKVLDTQDAILDLEDQQKEFENQRLDNIIDQYGDLQGAIDDASDYAQALIDLSNAQGKEISGNNYVAMLDAQTQKIAKLREEQSALTDEFNRQLASSTIVQGSKEWYDYRSEISQLDTEILRAQADLIELNDTVDNLTITKLGYQLSELSEQEAVIQRQLDLIEAQGGTATDDLYEKLIDIGFNQIEILNQQNAALMEQLDGLDPLSEKYQEIADQIRSNNNAINETMKSQEGWNDAVFDLKIEEINKAKDALSEANDEYQRQADLQKAIEDLERAKTQRQIRILENGRFKYVPDQKALADAQKNLDEKLHDETMAKFDKAIDALEELKKTSNVYETVGLTKIDPKELISALGVEDFLRSIVNSTNLNSTYADIISRSTLSGISSVRSANSTGSTITVPVTFEKGSIVTSANPDDVVSTIANKLSLSIEQVLHR